MHDKTVLMMLFAGSGVLLALIAIPMIRRKIKPNAWYGFRTPQTLRDPDVWYDANEYAGRRLFWAGIWCAVVALGLYRVPALTADGYALGSRRADARGAGCRRATEHCLPGTAHKIGRHRPQRVCTMHLGSH